MRQLRMRRNSLISRTPETPKQGVINFDTDEFKPSRESLKIYAELNAISEEIDQCRARNLADILID